MESETPRIQNGILDVFKFLKTFLEKHNLRYVACGGTVLGAVRHQNFIPWDDDMDIYMTRDDYNRLLSLRDEIRAAGYDIVSDADDGYYLPYAKVMDSQTTLWECKRYPFVIGCYFIDIFPLDNVEGTDMEILNMQMESRKIFAKYGIAVSHYTLYDLCKAFYDLKRSRVKAICKSWIYGEKTRKRTLAKFKQFIASNASANSDKCVCITQWEGRVFQKKWFEEIMEVPFADTTIIIPREHDKYLSLLYGDYMTPPPPEKRISQHSHYFVDFNHRLTIEQIKEIKKKHGK